MFPSLLLTVFQTNISKVLFNTDYGRKRATFWNSRQSYSSSQYILFCMFNKRRMKGREEGCKGCAGCLSQSRALACHLSVPYTLRLEYLSNIGRWLLWVKTIRFFLYSMQLCQNKHFVSHFHYQVKNLKNY